MLGTMAAARGKVKSGKGGKQSGKQSGQKEGRGGGPTGARLFSRHNVRTKFNLCSGPMVAIECVCCRNANRTANNCVGQLLAITCRTSALCLLYICLWVGLPTCQPASDNEPNGRQRIRKAPGQEFGSNCASGLHLAAF